MTIARLATMSLLAAALAGCVPRAETPPPAAEAPPPPAETPPPQPSPVAPVADWANTPLSPGGWAYRVENGMVAATFGGRETLFTVRCEGGGRIALIRTGAGGGEMRVRTSYGERRLPVAPTRNPQGAAAYLSASDRLLDEMVFSRGRFAVDAPGAATLILPAWPEPARVVEDCRG